MTSLVLGPIIFRGYEIPESVKGLAGKQTLAVHKLIGGVRVVDAMGPDDSDRHWSGRLQGADATDRALLLDTLRIAGAQLAMSVGSFFAIVVINNLELTFERSYQILYEISVTVIDSGAGAGVSAAPSLDNMVASDVALAQAAASAFADNVASLASDLASVS